MSGAKMGPRERGCVVGATEPPCVCGVLWSCDGIAELGVKEPGLHIATFNQL
jgi:hypothetical protein